MEKHGLVFIVRKVLVYDLTFDLCWSGLFIAENMTQSIHGSFRELDTPSQGAILRPGLTPGPRFSSIAAAVARAFVLPTGQGKGLAPVQTSSGRPDCTG